MPRRNIVKLNFLRQSDSVVVRLSRFALHGRGSIRGDEVIGQREAIRADVEAQSPSGNPTLQFGRRRDELAEWSVSQGERLQRLYF